MKLKSLFASALLIGLIAGCEDKKDDTPDPPAETKASVEMEIEHMFDGQELSLGEYFTLNSNTQVAFSLARFYVGNPMLMDDAMNATALSPQFTLVTPSITDINLGKVNPGHVHMFNCDLGVDSTTNATVQPTDFSDASNPLAPQNPSMWWTWNSGYIFYQFEGNLVMNGTDTSTFVYHIGLNQHLISKSKMVHQDIEAGQTLEVHMMVDYSKIFDGLDLSTELETHTMNNIPLAEKIKTNFDTATTIEAHSHDHK